eukprot:1791772-Prymnesium_polylepis.1
MRAKLHARRQRLDRAARVKNEVRPLAPREAVLVGVPRRAPPRRGCALRIGAPHTLLAHGDEVHEVGEGGAAKRPLHAVSRERVAAAQPLVVVLDLAVEDGVEDAPAIRPDVRVLDARVRQDRRVRKEHVAPPAD